MHITEIKNREDREKLIKKYLGCMWLCEVSAYVGTLIGVVLMLFGENVLPSLILWSISALAIVLTYYFDCKSKLVHYTTV